MGNPDELIWTDHDGDTLWAKRRHPINGMRVLYIDSADGEIFLPAAAVDSLQATLASPTPTDRSTSNERELARARAAGYRQAYENARECVQNHGKDADAEMLLVFLARGAELRESVAEQETDRG